MNNRKCYNVSTHNILPLNLNVMSMGLTWSSANVYWRQARTTPQWNCSPAGVQGRRVLIPVPAETKAADPTCGFTCGPNAYFLLVQSASPLIGSAISLDVTAILSAYPEEMQSPCVRDMHKRNSTRRQRDIGLSVISLQMEARDTPTSSN